MFTRVYLSLPHSKNDSRNFHNNDSILNKESIFQYSELFSWEIRILPSLSLPVGVGHAVRDVILISNPWSLDWYQYTTCTNGFLMEKLFAYSDSEKVLETNVINNEQNRGASKLLLDTHAPAQSHVYNSRLPTKVKQKLQLFRIS